MIAFPGLVTGKLKKSTVDPSKIEIKIPRRSTSASRSSATATFPISGTKPRDAETAK